MKLSVAECLSPRTQWQSVQLNPAIRYLYTVSRLNMITGVLLCWMYSSCLYAQTGIPETVFDFYGDSFRVATPLPDTNRLSRENTTELVRAYVRQWEAWNPHPLTEALLRFKESRQLDDWLFYQLIRKTAQQYCPKASDYERYTVFKWLLLTRCGYNATLKADEQRLLLYIQTHEEVFNLPVYEKNGQQYVCLNYHDFGFRELSGKMIPEIELDNAGAARSFSYRVNRLPETGHALEQKELRFKYHEQETSFTILLNPNIGQIFLNYPVVNYELYFNIPLSRDTYNSLMPALRQQVAGMSQRRGVDFLMRFTRYAFLFENDSTLYGREKRLSPEQTLLYPYSDCEDRAALFFYLVREIYRLPMIVLAYPRHITVAVKLDQPAGKPVMYNGEAYTIAEPTPQGADLALGKMLPSLVGKPYEVVYSYRPEPKP